MTPVQTAVLEHFQLDLDALLGTSKAVHVVLARHVAWYVERSSYGRNLVDIGALYGRDHSSISIAYNRVKACLDRGDLKYTEPVRAVIGLIDKAARDRAAKESLDAMACPTCGAPVINELRRQILALREQVEEMRRRAK